MARRPVRRRDPQDVAARGSPCGDPVAPQVARDPGERPRQGSQIFGAERADQLARRRPRDRDVRRRRGAQLPDLDPAVADEGRDAGHPPGSPDRRRPRRRHRRVRLGDRPAGAAAGLTRHGGHHVRAGVGGDATNSRPDMLAIAELIFAAEAGRRTNSARRAAGDGPV